MNDGHHIRGYATSTLAQLDIDPEQISVVPPVIRSTSQMGTKASARTGMLPIDRHQPELHCFPAKNGATVEDTRR
jgi:hypothetical protein